MRMNIKINKIKYNHFILLIFAFLLALELQATQIKTKQASEITSKKLTKVQDNVVTEAAEVVELTEKALGHLEKSEYKKAIATLESALGKIKVLTTDDSNKGNILIDFRVATYDLEESNQYIKDEKRKAEKALKKGHLQEAKRILDPLASEIVIERYYLALSNYPRYIKKSVQAIRGKKYDKANILLLSALNSVLVEEEVIPLPIIRAYSIIESLDTNLKKSKLNVKKANEKLAQAKEELTRAELLGYGLTKSEIQDLKDKIQLAEQKINSNQKPTKVLDKLRGSLKKLKDKIGD